MYTTCNYVVFQRNKLILTRVIFLGHQWQLTQGTEKAYEEGEDNDKTSDPESEQEVENGSVPRRKKRKSKHQKKLENRIKP